MFGPAGYSYIYFTYGMSHCMNIVTEKEGSGCAVLIRSILPNSGITQMIKNRMEFNKNLKFTNKNILTNGPGKLCIALGLTKNQNGIDLLNTKNFYIEDTGFKPISIQVSQRIGIKESTDLLYRFSF